MYRCMMSVPILKIVSNLKVFHTSFRLFLFLTSVAAGTSSSIVITNLTIRSSGVFRDGLHLFNDLIVGVKCYMEVSSETSNRGGGVIM